MILPGDDLLPGDEVLPRGSFALPPGSAPTVFTLEITDLFGNVLATPTQYSGVSVTMPLSDDRSATVAFSLYNPDIVHLKLTNDDGKIVAALSRMVRIKYRTITVFWGLVVSPRYASSSSDVTVEMQGPTFKLRSRYVNYSDPIAGPEEEPKHNPTDWTTVKALVDAAKDTASQYGENIPDIGVDVENVSAVAADADLWTDIARGEKNWDKIQEIAQTVMVEFEVVPYDPTEDELPFDTTLVPMTP